MKLKDKMDICSKLRSEYNHNFKSDPLITRSFHDLLWQINVNGMLDTEEKPVLFHVDVLGEHGTELILAYSSGGFKRTSVYFVSDDYNHCSDIAEELNEKFFGFDEPTQMRLISLSMGLGK
jgi:hypothetical protein